MRGSFKASPWPLVSAHYATYVDVRTGKQRWQDHVAFGAPPLLAFAASLYFNLKLGVGASAGLLTASALLSALLFGAMLQVSDRAMGYAESRPTPSRATSAHARYLKELAANSGYASLVCVLAAVTYVVTSTTGGSTLRAATAIGLALGVHLGLVLLLVMRRVFLLTVERLDRAQTGADLEEPRPPIKKVVG